MLTLSEAGYYSIKIYEVEIVAASKRNIWYRRKIGSTFNVFLAVKEWVNGYVPVFRVIEIPDNCEYIKPPILYRDIHPCDCRIIGEKIFRTENEPQYFGFSFKSVAK